jgi:molybdopterin-guanine dinucleotide biosynthesis protein A
VTGSGRGATPEVAGIVLAGGRASRFGRDKLAEDVGGRPLLHHALKALAPIVTELLVVISPAGPVPALPTDGFAARKIRVVRDPEPFGGPLVAFQAALEATAASTVLLVAGDMPALQAEVLAAMLEVLADRDVDLVLLEAPGPVQSMPAAMRTAPARTAAADRLREGDRALRSLYDRLRTATIALADWTRFDPERLTLRDVDTPADLTR